MKHYATGVFPRLPLFLCIPLCWQCVFADTPALDSATRDQQLIENPTNAITGEVTLPVMNEPIPNYTFETNAAGEISTITNRFFATPDRSHKKITPEVVITAEGAVGNHPELAHSIEVDGNLNRADSVVMHLPATGAGSVTLRGHAIGVGLIDATGNQVWLGQIKDCAGEIDKDNRNVIRWRDAFEGIRADVVFIYGQTYFEQLVVLKENPVVPDDIDPNTARIFVASEFFTTPEPRKENRKIKLRVDLDLERKHGALEVDDEILDWGWMRMAEGKAFVWQKSSGAAVKPSVPTSKSWVKNGNRVFLFEFADYISLKPALDQLAAVKTTERNAMWAHSLPKPLPTGSKRQTLQLAKVDLADDGVVLDFKLVNSALINVNFGSYAKTGAAVVGTGGDLWNGYVNPNNSDVTMPNLVWNVGSTPSAVSLRVQNAPGQWNFATSDPMYGTYIYPWNGGNITLTINNLPVGDYDLYIYGHGADPTQNSAFTIYTNLFPIGGYATASSTNYAQSTNWVQGLQYVKVPLVHVSAGGVVTIVVGPDASPYAAINGLQISAWNQGPVASVGADQSIVLPNTATLTGLTWDDSYPPNRALALSWKKAAGFGTVSFNPQSMIGDSLDTVATFGSPGSYVLRFTVDDTQLNDSRDVLLSVNPANIPAQDTGWLDDAVPRGSAIAGDPEPWKWVSAAPAPLSGNFSHQSTNAAGFHQHYFISAPQTLTLSANDWLFCYVYLEADKMPGEIMLQWLASDASWWNHRAYWGADLITDWSWRVRMGPLPTSGRWVRLSVPASSVDLVGRTINGMAFSLYGGSATWDLAGKSTGSGLADTDGDGLTDSDEVYIYHSDPRTSDSALDPDDDGLTNLQEFNAGSNPYDPLLVAWGKNMDGQSTVWRDFPGVFGMAAGGSSVAGGFTLVITNQGRVLAWGGTNLSQVNFPSGLSNIISVAANGDQCAALKNDGTVVQWGQTYGTIPLGLNDAIAISAGHDHFLALRSNGTVTNWGRNLANCPANSPPPLNSEIKAIASGWYHNLALYNDGTVKAWGTNSSLFGWVPTNVPPNLCDVVAISAGALHSAALLNNGTVVAWGDNQGGETNVPPYVTNVVAIAAGRGYTLALRQDQSIVGWGSGLPEIPVGLKASSIVAGPAHALAIRTGVIFPLIVEQPKSQSIPATQTATFKVRVSSRREPAYQWQKYSTERNAFVNLVGATTDTMVLNNVQSVTQGRYRVLVTNAAGAVYSNEAILEMLVKPVITSPVVTQNIMLSSIGTILTVNATAVGSDYAGITYYWYRDGQLIWTKESSTMLTQDTFTPDRTGQYSVVASNDAGTTTSPVWNVYVVYGGDIGSWGPQAFQTGTKLTNAIGISAGGGHALALKEDGTVFAWGSNVSGQTNVPSSLNNVTAVAAGGAHSLALKEDGTVVAWGANDYGQCNVPSTLNDAIAIAAGGNLGLALRRGGTVVQWGQTNGIAIPANLSGVTAIAAGTNFFLALLNNKTVVGWGGNNCGQLNGLTSLANIEAIAAGGGHALALNSNGTVVAWGSNGSGENNKPSDLANVLAVAAGNRHSVALKNDGTIVSWGEISDVQTNVTARLISAGTGFTLETQFSSMIQYPIDVKKDVLLVFNSSWNESVGVKQYYLEHRPMITGANELGIISTINQTAVYDPSNNQNEFTNQIAAPILQWLVSNPTKHPSYIILFYGIPTRVSTDIYWHNKGSHSSVSVSLCDLYPGWKPFITHLNAWTNVDCMRYIDKLARFGSNSPGKLIISASASGYANTNYVLDDIRYSGYSAKFYEATNGLHGAGVPDSAIRFSTGVEPSGLPHLTTGTNLSGYASWGYHSSLGDRYATTNVVWYGNSSWYIIETSESFNGWRGFTSCNFGDWFSENAFGGTNWSNTPAGAVCHVDEPSESGVNRPSPYFGLWASGKNFAICAWNSTNTPYVQVVGDPFIKR